MKFSPGSIIAAFGKKPAAPLERFIERFGGRTLIVHEGLSIGWVAELLKEAGGGGHFRFDIRNVPSRPATPIEWLVHNHIAPLQLPLPLLMRVETSCLQLRHLTRNGKIVHPSEIYWMLRELPTRAHWVMHLKKGQIVAQAGIAPEDNRVDFDLGEQS